MNIWGIDIADFIVIVISTIALVISIFSLLRTHFQTKAANKIAREAKQMAEDTKFKPKLRFRTIEINPAIADVYGGKNITWTGKEEFIPGFHKKIENSKKAFSLANFGKNSYLLFNLCNFAEENPLPDNTALILNALTFTLENVSNVKINKLSILGGYAILTNNEAFVEKIDMKSTLPIPTDDKKIAVSISYATFPAIKPTCIGLATIAELINSAKLRGNKSPIILYPDNVDKSMSEKVKQIFISIDTAILFECSTEDGKRYYYTFSIAIDAETGEIIPSIYQDREHFDKNAAEIERKNGPNALIGLK